MVRYGIFGSSIQAINKDPFLKTVKALSCNDDGLSVLKNYFKSFNPESIGEVIGVNSSSPLCCAPANLIQYLVPWNRKLTSVFTLQKEVSRLYSQKYSNKKMFGIWRPCIFCRAVTRNLLDQSPVIYFNVNT